VKHKGSLHEFACVASVRSRGRGLLWNHFPIVMPTWIGTKYTCSADADRRFPAMAHAKVPARDRINPILSVVRGQ
jgi:hypothetical protein